MKAPHICSENTDRSTEDHKRSRDAWEAYKIHLSLFIELGNFRAKWAPTKLGSFIMPFYR